MTKADRLTHFEYRAAFSANGGFDGHQAFPKGVTTKDRRTFVEHGPGHLYNDWFVVGRGLRGNKFHVAVESRNQGEEAPKEVAAILTGDKGDVVKMHQIASWLRAHEEPPR